MNDIELWQGDCLELMKDIPDKSIDCIICDLPYGTTACKWDSIIPFEPLWEQYNRIIKDNGAICLFGSEPFSSKLRMSNLKMFKYDWYWNKTKPVGFANAKKMPLKDVETISVFYKKLPNYSPLGLIECNKIIDNSTKTKKQNNITAINGGAFKTKTFTQQYTNYPRQILKFSVEQGLHPTQKPVPLCEYLIKTYTNEGETVLDNCMGSGSTGIACINTNRNFIGIELDNTYFEIAKKRIEEVSIKSKIHK